MIDQAGIQPSPSFMGTPAWMQACLRWAATGILPSRRIQDFLSINNDGGRNGFVIIPIAPLPCLANYLTSTPSVIPAQAGIQWFNNPFPQRGNDNYRNDNSMRHPLKLITHSPSRPRFLDSSLRWNDNGGRNGFVIIPTAPLPFRKNLNFTPIVIPAKAGIHWF